MKIDMNVISIILVVLAIFPYVLLPYIQYCSEKKLKSRFKLEEDKNGLHIDIKDRWGFNIIGTDLRQKKLLFVQRRNEDFFVEIMELTSLMDCIVRPEFKRLNVKGKEEDVLQRVDLDFYFKFEKNKIVWNLYDSDISYIQDLELKHAEKWCKIIKNQLDVQPLLKHTA